MQVVADIEADALLDDVTRVWCIVCKEVKTGKRHVFHPPFDDPDSKDFYKDFLEFSRDITKWVGHNFLSYDAPVLNKIIGTNIKIPDEVTDTLILSRLFNPERSGHQKPHSLEAWGERIGVKKIEFNDWSKFTPEMLKYCIQDVETNFALIPYLLKEGADFTKTSIRLEHWVRHIIDQQEARGWAVDEEKLNILIMDTGKHLQELETPLKELFKPKAKPLDAPDKNSEYRRRVKWVTRKEWTGGYTVSNKDRKVKEWQEYEEPSRQGLSVFGDDYSIVGGDFCLFEYQEFNPSSVTQIKERLFELGWEPTEFKKPTKKQIERVLESLNIPPSKWYRSNAAGFSNLSKYARTQLWEYQKKHGKIQGSPLVDEDTMEDFAKECGLEEVKKLSEYLMVNSRHSMAKSWLEHVVDGKLHGEVNTLGAVTNRMTHRNPNLANIPAVKKDKDDNILYGKEGKYSADCRAAFKARRGYVLFGTDASGLELRMLSHYMKDLFYQDIVVNGTKEKGTDIHTINQKLADLPTRDNAKTFIYGFIYGAGDEKIGKIVGAGRERGKRLREQFLSALPALKRVIQETQEEAEQGWLYGLDGRKIWIRSKNAALNTKLQSAGAIVCKAWLVYIQKGIDKLGLRAYLVGSIHDEYQFEVHPDDIAQMKIVCKEAIKAAEKKLNVDCPLDCGFPEDKFLYIGNNWSLTH